MADGIDAGVNRVQPPPVEPAVNRPPANPDLAQLPSRDNAVLIRREPRHLPKPVASVIFAITLMVD